MFLKKLFSKEEKKLKRTIESMEGEVSSLRFSVSAWQKIHCEDMQAIRDCRKEIVGLRFLLDQKDTEIEDLKSAIQAGSV